MSTSLYQPVNMTTPIYLSVNTQISTSPSICPCLFTGPVHQHILLLSRSHPTWYTDWSLRFLAQLLLFFQKVNSFILIRLRFIHLDASLHRPPPHPVSSVREAEAEERTSKDAERENSSTIMQPLMRPYNYVNKPTGCCRSRSVCSSVCFARQSSKRCS